MKRSPFRRSVAGLRVDAAVKDEVDILLYDEIGFWGITAADFRRELDGIKASTINLRLNSPGGDVFDGIAIYNALREHPAKVITHIDGVAASMASMIALAGDEVRMAENGFLMIHNPWAMVVGNADDLRKEAELLDQISGSMLMAYEAKSPATSEQIKDWMADETWFTAADAKEAGFVDEVIGVESDDEALASVAATFDLSIYAHVPAALSGAESHEPTVRDLERALRDAGLSQIAAKQFVSAGRAVAEQRDVAEAGERDVTPEPVLSYIFPGI